MRIAVLSDSHGNITWMNKMKPVFDSVDCIIHLGDYVHDARTIETLVKCPVYYVAGNGDIMTSAEIEFEKFIGGVKVFATHGHKYYVNDTIYSLSEEALAREAKLCLYGHTHVPDISSMYGIWFVNPGSISRPRGMSRNSYAVIDINNGEITPDIITLD